jgi:Helix-turn-helix domain
MSALTIEQVIGARVAHYRRERGMSQTEFGHLLEPFTGSAWSRANLGLAENGRRSWSANDILSAAMALQVPIAELFTPMPDQHGELHTAGGAVVTSTELAKRTARPALIPTADAQALTADAEALADKVATFVRWMTTDTDTKEN